MTRPDWVVAVTGAAAGPLSERTALIEESTGSTAQVVCSPRDLARFAFLARGSSRGAYLLDVNLMTVRLALVLKAIGVPFVIDTGDDPGALAQGLELGRRAATARRLAESAVLAGARGVICRGYYHRPALVSRTSAPVAWIPDTAPDWMYDLDVSVTSTVDLCTFGSTGMPRQRFPQVYGQEVVDALARSPELTGVIVGRGRPGLLFLQHRAVETGCADRLLLAQDLHLRDLAAQVLTARFLTSWQTDDLAGWVRTTGKLPLALALGRCVIATRVGEAARVLPPEFLITTEDDPVAQIVDVVGRGVPDGWAATARGLAETYRRSTVATGLRNILESWT